MDLSTNSYDHNHGACEMKIERCVHVKINNMHTQTGQFSELNVQRIHSNAIHNS